MQCCCCWGIWMKRSYTLYTQLRRTDSRLTQWTLEIHCTHRKLLTSNTETFHSMHLGPNVTLPISTPNSQKHNPYILFSPSNCNMHVMWFDFTDPFSFLRPVLICGEVLNKTWLPFFFYFRAACLPALWEQKNVCFAECKSISVIKEKNCNTLTFSADFNYTDASGNMYASKQTMWMSQCYNGAFKSKHFTSNLIQTIKFM